MVAGDRMWGRGVRYALAAPAAVQGVRFLGKLGLALFLLPEDFGEASLAGLIVVALSILAMLGLDEAAIAVPRLSNALWRRMGTWHHASGAACGLVTAGVGFALAGSDDAPLLSGYLLALAPMVWLANLSVLPTALLVRERKYRTILIVELVATSTYVLVMLALAAAGARGWSLVGGLYANALVMVIGARRSAAPVVAALPPMSARADEPAGIPRTGAHLGGAALLVFLGERVDALFVGFGLGRLALGLFELAQHFAGAIMGTVQSLSERLLLPTLASEHREQRLRAGLLEALAIALAFLVPLQVVLALTGGDLIAMLYPEEYAGAAAILPWLALAAGLRCVELPALTALKAGGWSGAVLKLAGLRLALALVALAAFLQAGLLAVVVALLVARACATIASLATAALAVGRAAAEEWRALICATKALCLWAALFVVGERWILAPLALAPAMHLVSCALLAGSAWLLARRLFERERLSMEWQLVRTRALSMLARRRA